MSKLTVYLRDNGEVAERFFAIKEHLGIQSDTETLRCMINWYWKEHEGTLQKIRQKQPEFKHLNINQDGALILDRKHNKLVHLSFKRNIIFCDECQTQKCEHVEFAISHPEIREAWMRHFENSSVDQ